jgi:quaternary ammonium compound-resistance protein SugE
MNWFLLVLASICEISWAVGLKYSNGLTDIKYSVFTVVTMLLSFVFLSQASRQLPIGTAYAVWTGIGAAGTAVYGMLFFNEPRDIWKVLCLLLIISGVTGLKLLSKN